MPTPILSVSYRITSGHEVPRARDNSKRRRLVQRRREVGTLEDAECPALLIAQSEADTMTEADVDDTVLRIR